MKQIGLSNKKCTATIGNYMHETPTGILIPEPIETKQFHDANDAWEHVNAIYTSSITFLRSKFQAVFISSIGASTLSGILPEIRITTTTYDQIDSRLSFGHVPGPGRYSITVTRPDLFKNYLTQQMALLIENHKVAIEVAVSKTAIPIHFAMIGATDLEVPSESAGNLSLRDIFDVPDLGTTNDDIVNGLDTGETEEEALGLFTATG